jgi:predicted nucleic acid-binding Zn ribbon protein
VNRRQGGEPTPVSDALAAVRSELGLPDPDALTAIREGWVDLVGHDLAARSRPVGLRDRALRVAADDAVGATELRYRAADLLARIPAIAPGVSIAEVRVSVVPREA